MPTWTCPSCKREYGDPLYHGPGGHAPPLMCFDCWCQEWEYLIRPLLQKGSAKANRELLVLYLRGEGLTGQEIADRLHVCRRTVVGDLMRLRKNFAEIAKKIAQITPIRVLKGRRAANVPTPTRYYRR